jgi:hypothetical protein
LLVGKGRLTGGTWPSALASRLFKAKTHKMRFASSLSGLPESKGCTGTGTKDCRPTILRRA